MSQKCGLFFLFRRGVNCTEFGALCAREMLCGYTRTYLLSQGLFVQLGVGKVQRGRGAEDHNALHLSHLEPIEEKTRSVQKIIRAIKSSEQPHIVIYFMSPFCLKNVTLDTEKSGQRNHVLSHPIILVCLNLS